MINLGPFDEYFEIFSLYEWSFYSHFKTETPLCAYLQICNFFSNFSTQIVLSHKKRKKNYRYPALTPTAVIKSTHPSVHHLIGRNLEFSPILVINHTYVVTHGRVISKIDGM